MEGQDREGRRGWKSRARQRGRVEQERERQRGGGQTTSETERQRGGYDQEHERQRRDTQLKPSEAIVYSLQSLKSSEKDVAVALFSDRRI